MVSLYHSLATLYKINVSIIYFHSTELLLHPKNINVMKHRGKFLLDNGCWLNKEPNFACTWSKRDHLGGKKNKKKPLKIFGSGSFQMLSTFPLVAWEARQEKVYRVAELLNLEFKWIYVLYMLHFESPVFWAFSSDLFIFLSMMLKDFLLIYKQSCGILSDLFSGTTSPKISWNKLS